MARSESSQTDALICHHCGRTLARETHDRAARVVAIVDPAFSTEGKQVVAYHCESCRQKMHPDIDELDELSAS